MPILQNSIINHLNHDISKGSQKDTKKLLILEHCPKGGGGVQPNPNCLRPFFLHDFF